LFFEALLLAAGGGHGASGTGIPGGKTTIQRCISLKTHVMLQAVMLVFGRVSDSKIDS